PSLDRTNKRRAGAHEGEEDQQALPGTNQTKHLQSRRLQPRLRVPRGTFGSARFDEHRCAFERGSLSMGPRSRKRKGIAEAASERECQWMIDQARSHVVLVCSRPLKMLNYFAPSNKR